MADIVLLHQAPRASTAVAYGQHGRVQVFDGQEARFEDLRANFERVLSFEPRSLFFLVETADSVLYVRTGRS
jgi:hypothetical protein